MTSSLIRIVALGCVVLLLQGCPKSNVLTIYNNSGADFVLQLENGQAELSAGSTVKIADEKGAISWNSLLWEGDPNTNYIPTLTLKDQKHALNYKLMFHSLPDEYVDYSSSRITYALQLESDDGLYIAKAKSSYPIKKSSQQPAGFPLMPTSSAP